MQVGAVWRGGRSSAQGLEPIASPSEGLSSCETQGRLGPDGGFVYIILLKTQSALPSGGLIPILQRRQLKLRERLQPVQCCRQ